MLAELGLIATLLALVASLYALVTSLYGARRSDSLVLSARNAALAVFPLP